MVTLNRFRKQEKLHSPNLLRAAVLRSHTRALALIGLCLCFALPGQSQVTVAPFINANPQFSDNNGVALASGCLFTYAAGTTSPLATYTDSTGSTPNSNPVILSSAGYATSGGIWLSASAYKFKLVSSGGVNCATGTTLWTQDNLTWSTPLSTFSGITIAGNENVAQPTAATGSANQSSFTDCLHGTYWTGAASADDKWCLQDVLGTGSNPTTTETLSHSGSSGASTVDLTAAATTKMAAATITGALTAANPNNSIVVENVKYPFTSAGVLQAISDCNASTSCNTVDLRLTPSITLASALSITSKSLTFLLGASTLGMPTGGTFSVSSIKFLGMGPQLSIICANTATGDLFPPSGTFFEVGNTTIQPCAGITRTAGWFFNPTGTGKFGYIHDNFIVDPYNGIQLAGSGGTGPRGWRIYRNTWQTSTGKHSGTLLQLGGGDGSAIDSTEVFDNFSSGLCATADTPQLLFDSGSDTNKFINWNMGYSTAGCPAQTQPTIKSQNTVGASFAPRWTRFEHLSNEAAGTNGGSAPIFNLTAATQWDITDAYMANANQCVNINGAGVSGIHFHGGVCGGVQAGGIYVTTAISQADLLIEGMTIGECSLATTNTTDCIQIAGGTTDFMVVNNTFDRQVFGSSATNERDYINLTSGASTRYTVAGNTFNGNFVGTANFNDSTTGTPVRYVGSFDGSWTLGGSNAGLLFNEVSGGPTSAAGFAALRANSTSHCLNAALNTSTYSAGCIATALGATSQKAETGSADANVLTFTPFAVVGTYRVHVAISVSSATAGVISYTVSWTDSNGNAQSNIAGPLFQFGTAAPNTTFTTSAAGNYSGEMLIDTNNAAANIVVKWVGGGTTAAKMSATVERVQ